MTADNRLQDYPDHIRQAVADARRFVDSISLAKFLDDQRIQQAVAMSLIVLFNIATPHGTRGHSTHICSGCLSAAAVV